MSVDFPRAWEISRAVPVEKHHDNCIYRVSNGGFLCDCHILYEHPEYKSDKWTYSTGGKPYVY